MSHEAEYGLVMPFVVCQSKGGPYDDDAYVAGYEAGHLDAILRYDAVLRAQGFLPQPPPGDAPFHAENRPQLDLIAMRHGWSVEFSDSVEGWVYATFRRVTEGSM